LSNKLMLVTVMTPDDTVFSGRAKMVIARSTEGDIGILPGHAPLITPLATGELCIFLEQEKDTILVTGGILWVDDEGVVVLADDAQRP